MTPAKDKTGTSTITVVVDDGTATTSGTFVLSVNSVANTAPFITEIKDQTMKVGTESLTISFGIDDLETDVSQLQVTSVSSNQTLVPNANIVLDGTSNSRTIKITPVPELTGQSTITVMVSDGSDTTLEMFVLTVNPASSSNTLTITQSPFDSRVSEGSTLNHLVTIYRVSGPTGPAAVTITLSNGLSHVLWTVCTPSICVDTSDVVTTDADDNTVITIDSSPDIAVDSPVAVDIDAQLDMGASEESLGISVLATDINNITASSSTSIIGVPASMFANGFEPEFE